MIKKLLSITIFIATITTNSFSQTWLPKLANGVDQGAFTYVNAIEKYNGNIIIGGEFSSVSGVSANYVAQWNGTSWQAMGAGLPALVKCLKVFNNELYAGVDVIGSNALFKWTGTSWVSAGTMTKSVYALYADEVNNILYAGGSFTSPGKFVAKMQNNTWTGVGTITTGTSSFPACYALTKFKDTLYAGGTFGAGSNHQYVAKYNPTLGWVALHNDKPNGTVYGFAEFRDTLYIGGNFTKVGTQTGAATRWHVGVAKYDTKDWSQLVSGIVGPNTTSGEVYDLAYYNGEIYAAGTFTDIYGGNPSTPKIARFDGTQWNSVETGLDNTAWRLKRLGDTLYVGGRFTNSGSITGSNNIAAWYKPFTGCTDPLYHEFHSDVDISDPNACQNLILTPPTASFSSSTNTICEDQSVYFNSTSTNSPSSVSWSFPGGTPSTSTSPSQTVVYASSGVYDVILTATNAAGNHVETKSSLITVNVCLGQNELELTDFKISPNPFSEKLTISSNLFNTEYFVEIIDVKGQVLLNQMVTNKKIEINTGTFENGLYIVRLSNNQENITYKLIKN